VVSAKKEMAVAYGQNALILEKVQLEGKRPMIARGFLNGHTEIIDKIIDSVLT